MIEIIIIIVLIITLVYLSWNYYKLVKSRNDFEKDRLNYIESKEKELDAKEKEINAIEQCSIKVSNLENIINTIKSALNDTNLVYSVSKPLHLLTSDEKKHSILPETRKIENKTEIKSENVEHMEPGFK